jgi:hypothetical protein
MSGLAGLSQTEINFLTGNIPIGEATRAELRNFLSGRITTASDLGEFSNALKTIAQDVEASAGLPEGQAMGEILGALEGGAVVEATGAGIIAYKANEIFDEIMELATKSENEQRARNQLRDQIEQERERGVIHGAQGTPSRDVDDLIRQINEQRARAIRKRGGFNEDVKIDMTDPIRQRPARQVVEDVFEDVALDIGEETPLLDEGKDVGEPRDSVSDKTAAAIAGGVAGVVSGVGSLIKGASGGTAVPPNITLKPTFGKDRKKVGDNTQPEGRKQFGDNAPEEDDAGINEQEPKGEPLLRPFFKDVGTDFFDRMYDTPLKVQNSEWADYDFVDIIDRQNNIEIDNVLGQKVRFQAPLYYPKYQAPLAPPTKQSIILKQIPMKREIQLSQPFMPKFDGADMGQRLEMTTPYNMSVFDYNFKNLKIYNPV